MCTPCLSLTLRVLDDVDRRRVQADDWRHLLGGRKLISAQDDGVHGRGGWPHTCPQGAPNLNYNEALSKVPILWLLWPVHPPTGREASSKPAKGSCPCANSEAPARREETVYAYVYVYSII